MSNANAKFPHPVKPRASNTRITAIIFLTVVVALLMTCVDAWTSYDGFKALPLPKYIPLILATLIFVVQLNVGALQTLGLNPFHGIGGNPTLDFFYIWLVSAIYIIDVGSNAIAFNIQTYLTWGALRTDPVGNITMAIVMFVCALLLTFGDELLLRKVERLDFGSKANAAAIRKYKIEQRAYGRFLNGYESTAIAQAETAGESAVVQHKWLKETSE